jgi:hypothetical protein
MSIGRATAGILVTVGMVALLAVGQQESASRQTEGQARIEDCKAVMPVILKNYNNAKYAVFLARNSGDGMLDRVNTAQAALDAMEQPLKVCSDAMQKVRGGAPQEEKK